MSDCIPALIGGDLARFIRYKGNLVRAGFKNKVNEFLIPAIAFDIKFRYNYFPDLAHIVVTDVSFIRTWMHRYTISTESLSIHCSFQYIRIITSPAVAERGDFINVYGEFDHEANLGKRQIAKEKSKRELCFDYCILLVAECSKNEKKEPANSSFINLFVVKVDGIKRFGLFFFDPAGEKNSAFIVNDVK